MQSADVLVYNPGLLCYKIKDFHCDDDLYCFFSYGTVQSARNITAFVRNIHIASCSEILVSPQSDVTHKAAVHIFSCGYYLLVCKSGWAGGSRLDNIHCSRGMALHITYGAVCFCDIRETSTWGTRMQWNCVIVTSAVWFNLQRRLYRDWKVYWLKNWKEFGRKWW
jgi:hypothetical protein